MTRVLKSSDVELLGNRAVDQFLRYYFTARGDEMVLGRDQLSMRDLSKLLPDIAILELRSPSEIFYRLAGTNVVHRIGKDPTGENFLALTPRVYREAVSAVSWQAAEFPCGHCAVYEGEWGSDVKKLVYTATLPLRGVGESLPTQLISISNGDEAIRFGTQQEGELQGGRLESFAYVDLGAGVPEA